MAKRKKKCYSGIGGQAVLEGIMMKNQEKYAVAVRKANGEITVEMENYQGLLHGRKIKEIPFIRGIFNFLDSMILGMRCLNFSASLYDEEDGDQGNTGSGGEKAATTLVTVFSVALAVGIFVILPYFLASRMKGFVRNDSLMAIIEGALRIAIFILYVWGISFMKDIRRLYRYHGAEHKCINCIEKGRPLTVHNVMRSSRLHRRCGTSFIFFVMLVSIILFFFIRVDNPVLRVFLRILLMPVVAGISYEIIRLAGRSNNIFVLILSLPGMWIQRMTTKEPDREMVKVAIAAVEAVFDWKTFLYDNFGYEVDETWMDDGEDGEPESEAVWPEGGAEDEYVPEAVWPEGGAQGEYAPGTVWPEGGAEGEYVPEAVWPEGGAQGEYAPGTVWPEGGAEGEYVPEAVWPEAGAESGHVSGKGRSENGGKREYAPENRRPENGTDGDVAEKVQTDAGEKAEPAENQTGTGERR